MQKSMLDITGAKLMLLQPSTNAQRRRTKLDKMASVETLAVWRAAVAAMREEAQAGPSTGPNWQQVHRQCASFPRTRPHHLQILMYGQPVVSTD